LSPIAIEQRQAMAQVMLELAYRNHDAEAHVMRIANAGELTEVTAEIKRRRIYAKNMGLAKQRGEAEEPATKRKPRKGRKKQAGGGAGGDSESANPS